MATHAPITGAPIHARQFRLTAAQRTMAEQSIETLIALLDDADGDTDREPEEDRCEAGDDASMAGPVADRARWWETERRWPDRAGSDDDAEPDHRVNRSTPTEFACEYAGDSGFGS